MNNKMPDSLYSRPGVITDPEIENWFESKIYTIDDLKNDLTSLELNDLFYSLMEMTSKDIVNVEVIAYVIGDFEKVNDSILKCNFPYNKNLIHCLIYCSKLNEFLIAKAINFYFNNSISLSSPNKQKHLQVESKWIREKLTVSIIYPLYFEKGEYFTNQLLIKYD